MLDEVSVAKKVDHIQVWIFKQKLAGTKPRPHEIYERIRRTWRRDKITTEEIEQVADRLREIKIEVYSLEQLRDSRNDRILDLWYDGFNRAEISDKVGLNENNVNTIVVRARKTGDPRAIQHEHVTVQRNDRVLDLWIKGFTMSKIAAELDITEGYVVKIIRRARDGGDVRAIRRSPGAKAKTIPIDLYRTLSELSTM